MNDSPKEMACLDQAQLWEGLIGWCEEMERDEIEVEVGRPGRDPAVMMSSFSDPGGAPALNIPQKKPKRLPAWWKNASQAVQRDWLRDREGR
jgi:hypothetical protein